MNDFVEVKVQRQEFMAGRSTTWRGRRALQCASVGLATIYALYVTHLSDLSESSQLKRSSRALHQSKLGQLEYRSMNSS